MRPSPDCYSEVLFGKLESKPHERWVRKFIGVQRSYQDARGWWFAITDQDPKQYWWKVSGDPVRELKDERVNFHDVLVTYDEPTRLSRGFLKVGDTWVQFGKAEHVIRGLSWVELKVTNFTPLFGTYREARFTDFRLYPNPKRHPARFVVTNNTAPYRGPRLRLILYTRDGNHRISEAYTNEGIAYLSLDSPAWVAFPVSAMLGIFDDEREIARSVIDSHGIDGLDPGEVWEFDSAQISL